jgi:RNase P subunit RPR2
MKKTTCAACDCELGANIIKVNLGGKSVEVCCEECAAALREADQSTSASSVGKE